MSERHIDIDGTEYEPIPYGEANWWGESDHEPTRCHDCGVTPGQVHKLGCDMEECPNCGGQYFICDCVTDEKRQLWGDA